MAVQIQTLDGIFLISVVSTENILELKKKIEIERGIASSSTIYYMGIKITDDDEPVANFLEMGNNTFTLLPSTDVDIRHQQKSQMRRITSERAVHLITGNRQKFEYLRILPNKPINFKIKSKKFGVVYDMEGEEIGQRLLHIEVFEIKESGEIELRSIDEERKVKAIFIPQHSNKPERELVGVIKTYDERNKINPNTQEIKWKKSVLFSKIADKLRTFINVIGELIFDGQTPEASTPSDLGDNTGPMNIQSNKASPTNDVKSADEEEHIFHDTNMFNTLPMFNDSPDDKQLERIDQTAGLTKKEKDKVFLNIDVAPISVTFVRGGDKHVTARNTQRRKTNKQDEIHKKLLLLKERVEYILDQTERRIISLLETGLNEDLKSCIKNKLICLKKKLLNHETNVTGLVDILESDLGELTQFIDQSI